jgi:hypothetical protein
LGNVCKPRSITGTIYANSELDGDTSIKGIDQILSIVDELVSSKKENLQLIWGLRTFYTGLYSGNY